MRNSLRAVLLLVPAAFPPVLTLEMRVGFLPVLMAQAAMRGSQSSKVVAVEPEKEAAMDRQALVDAVEAHSLAAVVAQAEEAAKGRVSVWVTGFPRSGSSTTLSLVKAASGNIDGQAPGHVFSVFEPCHEGDELEPWLQSEGCSGLLTHLAKCNFRGVRKLWGWPQPHTTNNHTKEYTQELASNLCAMSDVIAMKTVDYGHDLGQFLWLLDREPSLRILATVRDPRGIYASWKTTEPFTSLLKKRSLCSTCPGGLFYNLTQVCDAFAANLDIEDDRIHTIVFEDFLRDPVHIAKRAYLFMGKEFGQAQRDWINRTFDAADCPEVPDWHVGFSDCHTKSASQTEAWRTVLDEEELAIFNEHQKCRTVAEAYGYPLE